MVGISTWSLSLERLEPLPITTMEELSAADESSNESFSIIANKGIRPIQTIFMAIRSVMLTILQYAETLYIPAGIRTMYTDAFRGSELTTQLLSGHPERIRDMMRLNPYLAMQKYKFERLSPGFVR
jgi:hypothetical protein